MEVVMRCLFSIVSLLILPLCPAVAQQNPYFVTYDHHMEEHQNLELSTQSTIGLPKQNLPGYLGQLFELEYGVTPWWSSALYLEGASQRHDSTVFTGFRLENRLRLLNSEHKINPVLYFEYEHINEASRIKKEIVGHAEPSEESLSDLRQETVNEIEGKLIFSSDFKNWNIAENFIVEKNLTEDEGFEFGYALGVFRPLSNAANGGNCRFCRDRLSAGLELYGGLGSTELFGFKETAHYVAPVLVWSFAKNQAVRVSPGFGLTENSDRLLLRFGYTYEINGFGRKIANLFRGGN
jgi:hypothetical protein